MNRKRTRCRTIRADSTDEVLSNIDRRVADLERDVLALLRQLPDLGIRVPRTDFKRMVASLEARVATRHARQPKGNSNI